MNDAAARGAVLAVGEQAKYAHGGVDGKDETALELAQLHQSRVGGVKAKVGVHGLLSLGKELLAVEAEAQRLKRREVAVHVGRLHVLEDACIQLDAPPPRALVELFQHAAGAVEGGVHQADENDARAADEHTALYAQVRAGNRLGAHSRAYQGAL